MSVRPQATGKEKKQERSFNEVQKSVITVGLFICATGPQNANTFGLVCYLKKHSIKVQ